MSPIYMRTRRFAEFHQISSLSYVRKITKRKSVVTVNQLQGCLVPLTRRFFRHKGVYSIEMAISHFHTQKQGWLISILSIGPL